MLNLAQILDSKRRVLRLAVLLPLSLGHTALAAGAPTKIFTCAVGKKMVSVTSADGRLTYHYGTANKDELSIVGIPASGNVFQMAQRFAGMEYQLRFKNGEFNYIVFSSEGNGRSGASAMSGLVIMQGTKRISDKACSRYTDLTMPDDALAIPQDTDTYSAL